MIVKLKLCARTRLREGEAPGGRSSGRAKLPLSRKLDSAQQELRPPWNFTLPGEKFKAD